ncbi:MAG: AAA family ATPase [Actinomycetota bacterium]|nr:AAA family ATPase [Actinomycetota bacterium]
MPSAAGRNPSRPSSDLPAHLRERIRANHPQLEGERRTVTVVFVDAVASTALAERLDEEDVYYLMQGAISHMMEAIHRYEGVVTQFLGDGIIALFGAPIAHEDSARRAVSAALDMREALEAYAQEAEGQYGESLTFRIGLNTGPVVVGSISDDLEMDFTAIGDTINLAARMQQHADPGEILVSERTYRAVHDYFDSEDAGLLEVKGKAAPVRAWRPLRQRPVRTRIEAAAEHGLTPFVGREHELVVLRSYLEEALRGEGQVVFVAGEAGMGKSRLLLEFRRSVGAEVGWLEGHCISYGRAIPYMPITEVVRQSFGVEESDDEAAIIRRVEERSSGWDERPRALVPYLKYLLNVDPGPAVVRMDPRERQAGIFDALRTLLLLESRQRPLVVVVEDLHWVDDKSEEALGALVDVVAGARVLLVVTYRPGYSPSLGDRTYFSRLTLKRLPQQETASMTQAVLGADALPAELVALVNAKAEGNPFYTEEVTKSLLESGALRPMDGSFELARPVEELRLPDTIQEVILSRIDRLQQAAREALQLGSVIGREFTGRLLARISDLESQLDEALGELKRLELVYQKEYFPELSYMFKHALTHDVAYATLLRERRRALHRLVGAAIEELYPDRLAEQVETLAHHYVEGQAWDKALDYLVKAGDKAAGAYANKEALDYYQRALEVSERLGDPALRTATGVTEKRGFVNLTIADLDAAIDDFDRLRNIALRLGDRRLEGRALALRGLTELQAHDLELSEDTLRAALAIGEEGFEDVRLLASIVLGLGLTISNRQAEAEAFVALASELVEEVDDAFARAWWGFSAFRPHWAGRFDQALAQLERWRPAVEASGSATIKVANRWVEGLARGARGEYERALALIHEVVEEAEQLGEVPFRARAVNSIGWVYGELQDHERALEWSRRGVEAAQRIDAPDHEIEGNARLNVGDALLALGRLDEAEEQFAAVERIARDPSPAGRFMLWRYSQHLFHSYGELWLARGDADKALAYAGECLELAIQSDSRKNIVKGRRLRGEALLAQEKLDEAEQELQTALGVAQQIGNPTQLWKTDAALGRLRTAQGRVEEARDSYQQALDVIAGVAAGLNDETLRTVLLSSEQTQTVRSGLGGSQAS